MYICISVYVIYYSRVHDVCRWLVVLCIGIRIYGVIIIDSLIKKLLPFLLFY